NWLRFTTPTASTPYIASWLSASEMRTTAARSARIKSTIRLSIPGKPQSLVFSWHSSVLSPQPEYKLSPFADNRQRLTGFRNRFQVAQTFLQVLQIAFFNYNAVHQLAHNRTGQGVIHSNRQAGSFRRGYEMKIEGAVDPADGFHPQILVLSHRPDFMFPPDGNVHHIVDVAGNRPDSGRWWCDPFLKLNRRPPFSHTFGLMRDQ